MYACVECGRESSIKPVKGSGEVCERCGTVYTREQGAMIRCAPPNKPEELKHPSEWLDFLAAHPPVPSPGRQERVIVRLADTQEPYRHSGQYLGHVEQFGLPLTGSLRLAEDALIFARYGGGQEVWPLDHLTAVQPSSTTLQLKIRHGPIISVRFVDASPLLWEARLREAVQARFTASGKGDILEYQPRIICG